MSDIIRFRQLLADGYSICQISVNNIGQTVIKLAFPNEIQSVDGQFYLFSTQDQSVIQKANEIFNKKV